MKLLLSPDGAEGTAGGNEQATANAEANADILEGAEHAGEATAGEGAQGANAGAAAAGAGAGGAAATSGLSKDDVKEILFAAMEKVGERPAATAAAEPQMFAEDFEKAFNVFKFTPDMLAQLRHEDSAVALKAFHALRDGLIRQAMTMAEYRMKQYVDNLRTNDIGPLQTYVSEAQATSFRNDFFQEYPDLEKYETIVDAVATKLGASGFTAPTRKEVMARFADETKVIVAQLTATGGNGANNGGGNKLLALPSARCPRLPAEGKQGAVNVLLLNPKAPKGIEVFD